MDIKKFAQRVLCIVENELGDGYQTELTEVKENNGAVMYGLFIRRKGQVATFTVYLNAYWECYKSGMPFLKIIEMAMGSCRNIEQRSDMNADFIQSFEKVKDRICYRLIGREANRERLEKIPHIDYLDLAICFYYSFPAENMGKMDIPIKNEHMEMWQTTAEELYELAKKNTPKLFPWKCSDIWDAAFGNEESESDVWDKDASDNSEDGMLKMRVLTNRKKQYGAICILYPEVLAKLAEEGHCYYILPSSVHECILIRHVGKPEEGALREMVKDINQAWVAPEEVLTDSVYFYDASERKIRIMGNKGSE